MKNSSFVLTYWDIFIGPLYFTLIYLWAKAYQNRKQASNPIYKWYTRGLLVKCLGAVLVCFVYQFYYSGGDTSNYFFTSKVLSNVFYKDVAAYFRLLFGEHTWEAFSAFDQNTGYPMYWKDPAGFFASRLFSVLCIFSFGSYLGTSLLLATICYIGLWRLFMLFNFIFPNMEKEFTISFFYIPSVVFWGSGLLKDTVTLGATGLFAAHFYSFFIQRNFKLSNILYMYIAAFLLASIKPYILFALIPGAIIWLSNEQVARIKSNILRKIFSPFMFVFAVGAGYLLLAQLGNVLGSYSLDTVLEKAVISNVDQKQAYYGGNSFDIGDFDPTLEGVSKKAHLAIFATLFRPTLIEARNPLMLLSALENSYMLLLTLLLLFKLKFFGFFRVFGEKPLLLFSLLFALFFAFSVGIATSNFGTLVRLKIPCIPFYMSCLIVIKHLYEERTKKKLGI